VHHGRGQVVNSLAAGCDLVKPVDDRLVVGREMPLAQRVQEKTNTSAYTLEVEGLAENAEDADVRGHGNEMVGIINVSWLVFRRVERKS